MRKTTAHIGIQVSLENDKVNRPDIKPDLDIFIPPITSRYHKLPIISPVVSTDDDTAMLKKKLMKRSTSVQSMEDDTIEEFLLEMVRKFIVASLKRPLL